MGRTSAACGVLISLVFLLFAVCSMNARPVSALTFGASSLPFGLSANTNGS
jgi:uncharacterized integral membrane protein